MRYILTAIITVYFCGCAALFNQKSEDVQLTSTPSNAKVYVNEKMIGRTPAKVTLQASESHNIRFEHDSTEPKTMILNYHVGAGWVILGILTGLVPVIIDAATQSFYELDKNHVHAELNPT